MIHSLQHAVILAQAHQPIEFLPPTQTILPSLKGATSTAEAVKALVLVGVNTILGLAATAAVAGVMYGGFLMMSGGDKGVKGRKAILYSLGGLLVIAMAFAIVTLVTKTDLTNPQIGR